MENRAMNNRESTGQRLSQFYRAPKPHKGTPDRIPLSADLGAAAFVAVLVLVMHIGHAVGF